jgi:predicted membrane-bound spermidine synthase
MITLAGMGVGSQFPVAVAVLQKEKTPAYSAAMIWGADLFGATLGTLASAMVIIPVLGMLQTSLLGGLLGGISFLLLYLLRQRLLR